MRQARERGRRGVISQSVSVAHSVGLVIQLNAYLGFRLRLHPRLYAAARVRGLKMCKSLRNDKVENPRLNSIAAMRQANSSFTFLATALLSRIG
jgi:hypothetical protein